LENKASESSEGKFQKSNIFLNSTFNNDNLWIAILIVYFIAIIVACLSFAYYNWQGTPEPFNAPMFSSIKYDNINNTGLNTQDTASESATDNSTVTSSKTNTSKTSIKPNLNNKTATSNKNETPELQKLNLPNFGSQMQIISNKTETIGYNTTTTLVEQNATKIKTTTTTIQSSAPREIRLVWLSITFGALGAAIHGITSLVEWISKNKQRKSYFLWYLSRPLIGAALAVTVYLLLRASLLSSVTGLSAVSVINDFGVAGLSAIIGLMTPQIVTKLRDVFNEFFGIKKSDEEQGDKTSFAENIGLSIENPEIEEGKESLLIGIIKDNDGKPRKDVKVDFAIFDTNTASLKQEEHPHQKITDSNGIVIHRFQANKEGKTLAAINVTDTELYAKTPLKVNPRTAETKKSNEENKKIDEEKKAKEVEANKKIDEEKKAKEVEANKKIDEEKKNI
jgi:hypothetical protein